MASLSTISTFLRREWWIIAAAIVAAGAIALVLTPADAASYVGESSVKMDAAVVSKYPTLLVGERTLEMLEAPAFFKFAAETSGIPADTIKASLSTTASGKFLDTILIRYSAGTRAEAQDGAKTMADVILAYAYEVAEPEIDRQTEIARLNQAAIEKIRTLVGAYVGSPADVAATEYQLTDLEQSQVTMDATLRALKEAYTASGSATVSEAVGSSRVERLLAGLLAGLVAGVAIAVLRDRRLRVQAA